MDTTEKEEIRGYVIEAVGEAIRPLASDVALMRGEIHELRERDRAIADEQARLATNITQVSAAAAHAANIGLDAMKRAAETEDNATKIIKSALTIHNASIAATVDATVKAIVKPLADDVTNLKAGEEQRDVALADIQSTLAKVAKAIGSPRLRRALLAAAVVGALIGGAVAGYTGVAGTDAAKHLVP